MTVKTIGTGGDYSTIEAWEATLSGTFSVDQEGALFNELFTPLNSFEFGGFTTTTTAKLIIRAATAAETGSVSAKHNGRAGTGARVYKNGGNSVGVIYATDTNVKHWYVKDLEVFSDGSAANHGIYFAIAPNGWDYGIIENCIIHTIAGTGVSNFYANSTGNAKIINCAAWDIGLYGFYGSRFGTSQVQVLNCTIVKSATNSSNVYNGLTTVVAKNCYVSYFGPTGGASDFNTLDAASANNASFDSSGTSGLRTLSPTAQFLSVGGTWDLRLAIGSSLETAGAPVSGVTTDFEGTTRDVSTPDIGFDEVNPTASLTKTLANLTSSSAGTVQVTGTLSQTLGNLTLSSTGIGLAITGTLSATIDDLTSSAAGTVLATGSLSATIAAITSASAGTVKVTGAVASTLDALSSSSAGTVLVKGSLSTTIANLALASAGGNDTLVTLAKTLGNLTVVSAGNVYTPVAFSSTIGNLTSSSAGTVLDTAVVTYTIPAITPTATGSVRVAGTLSATVAALTSSSTGTVLVTGSVAKTIPNLTSTSAASAFTPVRLISTIPNLTLSSAGKVRITGTGVAHFSDLTSNSGGKVLVKGSLTKTIGPFSLHTRVINPNSGSSDRYYLHIPRFNIDHPPSSDDLTGHLLEKLRQQQQWLDALSDAALQSANTPPLNPRYGTLRYAVGDWAATLGAVGLYIFKESGWTLIS